MSTNSSSSGSSSGTPSPPLRNTSIYHNATSTQHIMPVIIPPAPMTVLFRRMSPQEDLVATLQGIDVLVRQRQELINRLVGRHGQLSRRNEIGELLKFSKDIDDIMK